MSRVQGTVASILTSNGKNGTTFYRFTVDGDQRQFGLGAKQPQFTRGQMVSFVTNKTERGFWEVEGNVETLAQSSPTILNTTTPSRNTSKDDYWTAKEARDIEKDKIIQLQSCRNSAIETVKLLLDKEAIKVPAANKRYDFILSLIDEVTQHYVAKNDGRNQEKVPDEPEQEEAQNEAELWQ